MYELIFIIVESIIISILFLYYRQDLLSLVKFFKWLFYRCRKIKPATQLKHTLISGEDDMVKYKLSWIQSVSPFSATQNIKGTVNGIATAFGSMAMNLGELLVTFAEGDNVDWYVETVGENAKTTNSTHDTFIATNEMAPAPATGLGHIFVEYIP